MAYRRASRGPTRMPGSWYFLPHELAGKVNRGAGNNARAG